MQECISGAVPEPQGLEFAAHFAHGVVLQCVVSDVKQMMAPQYVTFKYCTMAKTRVEHGYQPPVWVLGVGANWVWVWVGCGMVPVSAQVPTGRTISEQTSTHMHVDLTVCMHARACALA